jgi:organic radical activating enzyme
MDKDIDTLNLDYLKSDIIIKLFYCNINNLIIPKDLDNIKDYLFNTKNEKYVLHQSTVKNIKTNLTYHDWNNNMEDRLLGSHVTYETNIYVELKRICNMNCQFCRNKYLNNQEYNYNNIIKNLRKIYYNINNIVIGGGEPTLLLEDLKRLKQDVQKDLLETDTNFNIITNASLNVNSYNDLLKDYNIYFSRHAIDDYTNSLIFNDKNNNLLSANDLTKLTSKNLHKSHRMKNNKILCCTCVIGGIDSKTKILDYIKFAKEIGFNEVLFQTLDQDSLFLNNYDIGIKTINEQEIIKAFNYLERNGYNISNPIYSSSGYELYLLTNPTINMDISFKIYKKQEEIKTSWQTASKRCFDLSMDPSGEIYEDWQEKNKVYMYK